MKCPLKKSTYSEGFGKNIIVSVHFEECEKEDCTAWGNLMSYVPKDFKSPKGCNYNKIFGGKHE